MASNVGVFFESSSFKAFNKALKDFNKISKDVDKNLGTVKKSVTNLTTEMSKFAKSLNALEKVKSLKRVEAMAKALEKLKDVNFGGLATNAKRLRQEFEKWNNINAKNISSAINSIRNALDKFKDINVNKTKMQNVIETFVGLRNALAQDVSFRKGATKELVENIKTLSQALDIVSKFDVSKEKVKAMKHFINQITKVFAGTGRTVETGGFFVRLFGRNGVLQKLSNLKIPNLSRVGDIAKVIGTVSNALKQMSRGYLSSAKIDEFKEVTDKLIDVLTPGKRFKIFGRANIIQKLAKIKVGDVSKILKTMDDVKKILNLDFNMTKIANFKLGIDRLIAILTPEGGWKLIGKQNILQQLSSIGQISGDGKNIKRLLDIMDSLSNIMKKMSTIEYDANAFKDIDSINNKLGEAVIGKSGILAKIEKTRFNIKRTDRLIRSIKSLGELVQAMNSIKITDSSIEDIRRLDEFIDDVLAIFTGGTFGSSMGSMFNEIITFFKGGGVFGTLNKVDVDARRIKKLTESMEEVSNLVSSVNRIKVVDVDVGSIKKFFNQITEIFSGSGSFKRSFDPRKTLDSIFGNRGIFSVLGNMKTPNIQKIRDLTRAISEISREFVNVSGIDFRSIDIGGMQNVFEAFTNLFTGTARQKRGANPLVIFEGFKTTLFGKRGMFDILASLKLPALDKISQMSKVISQISLALSEISKTEFNKGTIQNFGDAVKQLLDIIDVPKKGFGNLFGLFDKKGLFDKLSSVKVSSSTGLKDTVGAIKDLSTVIVELSAVNFESFNADGVRKAMNDLVKIFIGGNFDFLFGRKSIFKQIEKVDTSATEKVGSIVELISNMSKVISRLGRVNFESFDTKAMKTAFTDLLSAFSGADRGVFDKILGKNKGLFAQLGKIEVDGTKISSIAKAITEVAKSLKELGGLSDTNINPDNIKKLFDVFTKGDVSKSIIEGLDVLSKSGHEIGRKLGKSIGDGFKEALGIASPSRVFMRFGGNVVDGFKSGVSKIADVALGALKRIGINLDNVSGVGIGIALGKGIVDGFQKTLVTLKDVVARRLSRIKGNVTKFAGFLGNAFNAVNFSGAFSGLAEKIFFVREAFETIVDVGQQVFEKTLGITAEFESAFAGVAKTLDTSAAFAEGGQEAVDAFLGGIRSGLDQMATSPESLLSGLEDAFVTLSTIAESAGQLGIAGDDVLGFTEVVGQLTLATDLSGDAAAFALARIGNVTGATGVEFEQLGSSLVALGNNFAATESEIIAVTERIVGVANAAGFSESEILGWSAAIRATGINAELGGSSFNRFISSVQTAVATGSDKLAGFARLSGQTVEEFKQNFEADASGALQSFVEGLGDLEGTELTTTLKDLGLNSAGLTQFFSLLAGSSENLGMALGVAEENFVTFGESIEDYNALQTEAVARSVTLESSMNRFKNVAKGLGDLFGQIMTPAFTMGLQFATELFSRLGTVITENREAIQRVIDTFVNGFVSATSGIFNFFGAVSNLFSTFLGISSPFENFWVRVGNSIENAGMRMEAFGNRLNTFATNASGVINQFLGVEPEQEQTQVQTTSYVVDFSVEGQSEALTTLTDFAGANEVTRASLENTRAVIVEQDDTLWDLSQQYGVTVDQLVEWNEIENPNMISVGQDLIISAEAAETLNDSLTEAGEAIEMFPQQAPLFGEETGSSLQNLPFMEEWTDTGGLVGEEEVSNVRDFSAILEEVQGSFGRIKESSNVAFAALSALNPQNAKKVGQVLSNSFSDIKSEAGGIFDALFGGEGGGSIQDLPFMEEWTDTGGNFLEGLFGFEDGGLFEGLKGMVTQGIESFKSWILGASPFSVSIGFLAKAIEDDILGIGTLLDQSALGRAVSGIITSLSDVFGEFTLGNILDFFSGDLDVEEVFSNLRVGFDGLKDGVIGLFASTFGLVLPEDISRMYIAYLDLIFGTLDGALALLSGEDVDTVVLGLGDTLDTFIGDVGDSLVNMIVTGMTNLGETTGLTETAEGLASTGTGIITIIQDIISFFTGNMSAEDALDGIAEDLQVFINEVGEGLLELVLTGLSGVASLLTDNGTGMESEGGGIGSLATEFTTDLLGSLFDLIVGTLSDISVEDVAGITAAIVGFVILAIDAAWELLVVFPLELMWSITDMILNAILGDDGTIGEDEDKESMATALVDWIVGLFSAENLERLRVAFAEGIDEIFGEDAFANFTLSLEAGTIFDPFLNDIEIFINSLEISILKMEVLARRAGAAFTGDSSGSELKEQQIGLLQTEQQVRRGIGVTPEVLIQGYDLATDLGFEGEFFADQLSTLFEDELLAGQTVSITPLLELEQTDLSTLLHGIGIADEDAWQLAEDLLSGAVDQEAFNSIASDVIAGFEQGLEDADASTAGGAIGEDLEEGTRETLGTQSPSTVFAAIGTDVMAGFTQGLQGISGEGGEAEGAGEAGGEGAGGSGGSPVAIFRAMIDTIKLEFIKLEVSVEGSIMRIVRTIMRIGTVTPSVVVAIRNMTDQIIANMLYLKQELQEVVDLVGKISSAANVGSGGGGGSGGGSGGSPTSQGGNAFGGQVWSGRQYEILEDNFNVPFELFRSASSGRTFFIPNENGEIISPLNNPSTDGNFTPLGGSSNVSSSTMTIQVQAPITIQGGAGGVDVAALSNELVEKVTVAMDQMAKGNSLTDRLARRGSI